MMYFFSSEDGCLHWLDLTSINFLYSFWDFFFKAFFSFEQHFFPWKQRESRRLHRNLCIFFFSHSGHEGQGTLLTAIYRPGGGERGSVSPNYMKDSPFYSIIFRLFHDNESKLDRLLMHLRFLQQPQPHAFKNPPLILMSFPVLNKFRKSPCMKPGLMNNSWVESCKAATVPRWHLVIMK